MNLEINHLTYRYRNQESDVLKDVSLEVRTGQGVGIVGPSGSGKTTLINLILGFDEPAGGEIFVNDINLSTVRQEDWLQHVAYMPQQPTLFPSSVADNIALGDPAPDEERLRKAAAEAGILEFIEALPEGFETLIGEGGRSVSGGEKQRIALARVFYKKAGLVIFDEPTASLDAETEHVIRGALARLKADRALIMVAHRLQTVKSLDHVYVLKEGCLIESGSHQSLVEAGGYYTQLTGALTNA